MAKTSMVNRELKRIKLAKKFAAKRAALKAVITDSKMSFEARDEAREVAQFASS